MKHKLAIFLIAVIIAIPTSMLGQTQFGLAAKASSNGLGADAVVGITKNIGIRAGFETMSLNLPSFTYEQSGLIYNAESRFKTGSFSVLVDFQFNRMFFATAGLGYNLFDVDIVGTPESDYLFEDITIPKAEVGQFQFNIGPGMKLSPYAGIGIGKPLNREKRMSMAFEIGTFIQGSPTVSIQSDGIIAPTSAPEHNQAQMVENQIKQYTLYPVLKLSISARIL